MLLSALPISCLPRALETGQHASAMRRGEWARVIEKSNLDHQGGGGIAFSNGNTSKYGRIEDLLQMELRSPERCHPCHPCLTIVNQSRVDRVCASCRVVSRLGRRVFD